MSQSAQVFLNCLQNDTDFYLEIGKAPSKAKRWELIKSHGFTFNDEELATAKREMDNGLRSKLEVVYTRSQGIAEMGDVPRVVLADGCGTCE